MRDIKLVIFDLDGTLVDAYRAIIRSFNYVMRQMGYPVQRDIAIRRAVGWGDSNLLAPFVRPEDLENALVLYRRHHKKSLPKYSVLMPQAKRTLDYLKARGYILAVASNRPTQFSRILTKTLSLEKYFDYMLCADKLRSGKPHPQILNNIRRRFSLSPQQVIYVGDMTIDAQAGARAGIRTVIISGGSSTTAQVRKERPWRIVHSLAALLKLL